jgi:LysR family hydrogen peroxide-inducible transcriptional activator
LPLFLPNFETNFPGVRLVVQELQTNTIVAKLRKDELDLGILVTPLKEKGIQEYPLFNEPMIGYVGESHRLSPKKEIDVADLDLDDTWLLSEGHCLRSQVLNICKSRQNNDTHGFVFESGSLETLERLVEMHRGMTVLPYLATLNLSSKQRKLLRNFKGIPPVREVGVVVNRIHIKTAMIEALKAVILGSIPEFLLKTEGRIIDI